MQGFVGVAFLSGNADAVGEGDGVVEGDVGGSEEGGTTGVFSFDQFDKPFVAPFAAGPVEGVGAVGGETARFKRGEVAVAFKGCHLWCEIGSGGDGTATVVMVAEAHTAIGFFNGDTVEVFVDVNAVAGAPEVAIMFHKFHIFGEGVEIAQIEPGHIDGEPFGGGFIAQDGGRDTADFGDTVEFFGRLAADRLGEGEVVFADVVAVAAVNGAAFAGFSEPEVGAFWWFWGTAYIADVHDTTMEPVDIKVEGEHERVVVAISKAAAGGFDQLAHAAAFGEAGQVEVSSHTHAVKLDDFIKKIKCL